LPEEQSFHVAALAVLAMFHLTVAA